VLENVIVPFNDIKRRFVSCREQLFDSWMSLFDDGIFVGGPIVDRFEREFARFCGVPDCVAVANGTDALEFALRALGVKTGDEVITVANAGGYTTSVCHILGAIPVYVDVELTNAQMCLSGLEGAVTPKTSAVVVTHLYGYMNDVLAIRKCLHALGREDVVIIEDCAQAHGASIDGRLAGSLGHAAAFSFYPTKNLGAVGDGGAVLCAHSGMAEKVRQLRQYGWASKYQTVLLGGRNSRLDPLQASVLLQQLGKLSATNSTRRKICQLYADNLPAGWNLIRSDNPRFVGHLAVTIAPNAATRDRAREVLVEREIGFDIHYPTLDCDQPAWRGLGRVHGNLERSRLLTQRVVSLPCFSELTASEIEQVIGALHAFT